MIGVRPNARLRIAGAILLAILWLGSCRQLADIEEREPCQSRGEAEPLCESCARSRCCDELVACRADTACAALDSCLAGCSDDESRSKCRKQHPEGFDDPFAVLAACSSQACPGACASTRGSYVFPSQKCATCAKSVCGPSAVACERSASCLALAFCERRCSRKDHACLGACRRRYETGTKAARALTECLASGCGSECGYAADGPDWSCAGEAPEPGVGPEVQLTYTVKLIDGPMGPIKPAAWATVRVCAESDDLCESGVLYQAKEDGTVTVKIPHGFAGHFAYQEGGLMPFLHYIDWRLLAEKNKDGTFSPTGFSPTAFESALSPVAPIDPTRGHLYVRTHDCAFQWAPGVSLQVTPIDAQSTPYYGGSGDLLDSFTHFAGEGGVLNLASGEYWVSVIDRDTMSCVFRRRVVVLAGTETQVGVYPGSCGED